MSDSPRASGQEFPVYFDGAVRRADEARFRADDHGVLFGLGFFETFRTSGGRPHDVGRHWQRLLAGCARIGVVVPPTFLARDPARLEEVVRELLRHGGENDAVFRYTLTAGVPSPTLTENRYERPVELLTVRSLPAPPPAEGVALRVLALARDGGEAIPRQKTLNHANALLGAHELERRGAPLADEGLFLDREGFVVETPRQALAWIRDDVFRYPDPSLGAIASTGLEWMREQLPAARPVRARLDELLSAEAVIVVNSVRGITPVREIWDGQDRSRLARFESRTHPAVVELGRRWSEALQSTAAGAV